MPATYQLLKSCKTTAVFQLESRGMKDLIRRLQPDRFGDIVALVALFRPGPLQSGMVEDFIARKHDTSGATIDYLHPELKPVLEATYGVILYQEQVMQIAQILAGYTLGGADLLRRAMGKKKPEEMAKQRSVFVSGAVARGVRESQATLIFDLMEKFAGLRLQQIALRGLRGAVLSDRMAQGALSGGVHGGRAVLRYGQDRQGRHAHRRMREHDAYRAPAGRERIGVRIQGRGTHEHPLRARRHQGRRGFGGAGDRRRACRPGPVPESAGSLPAHRSAAGESARVRGAHQVGKPRSARPEPRHAHRRARPCDAPRRAELARHERRAGGSVRLERGRAGDTVATGPRHSGWQASARRSDCS